VLELNGQTHELRRRVLLVGRRPGCDLVLGDPTSLEKHAVLFHAGDTWYVRGLDPKVKLALNGQRVLQAPLKEGDRLRMGVSEVRFVGSLPAVESRIDADARARLSMHEGRPTSEPDARAPGVTEGRVPTIAESRTQPEASTPAIEPEPTPRFVPPAQQREPAPQPIVGLTQPTSAQPAAPEPPTDLRLSAAGEPVVEEDPLDKSPVPIDAADIETIDLDEVRNWGPLAVAVAADRHPSLLRPTRSGDAEVAPPKAQRKWGLWVAVACTLLLAAGVVLALLMYRP
jgi:pSer/pThr/pTyr-binding forkhead associated (FHA) protein